MALKAGISYRDWVSRTETTGPYQFNLVEYGTNPISYLNLKTPRLREIARFTRSINDKVILSITSTAGTFANPWTGRPGFSEVDCIAILNHSLPRDGSVTINVIVTDIFDVEQFNQFKTINYNVGGVPNFNQEFNNSNFVYLLDKNYINVKEVKVIIKDAPAGLIDIGRLWIGNWLELDFDNSYTIGHTGGGKELLSVGNDTYLTSRRRRKRHTFDFTNIKSIDVIGTGDNFLDLSLTASTDSEVIVLPDVSGDLLMNQIGIYGKLQSDITISKMAGNNYASSVDVIEIV